METFNIQPMVDSHLIWSWPVVLENKLNSDFDQHHGCQKMQVSSSFSSGYCLDGWTVFCKSTDSGLDGADPAEAIVV